MNKVLFSHVSDDWATPDFLYWRFVLDCKYFDPCPLHSDHDSLFDDWSVYKNIFINPPFSNIMVFVEKAIETYTERRGDCDIVFLLPVRTDTKWFKMLMDFGCNIKFIDHRLKFGGAKYNAPFPCMLVTLDWFCSSFDWSHRCIAEVTNLRFEKQAYEDHLKDGVIL